MDTASSSLIADRLIRRSYLATTLQVLDDRLEANSGLGDPIFESDQILRVLSKTPSDGLIHEVGHRTLGLRRLVPQSTVDVRIEVDCCALVFVSHDDIITF